MSGTQTGGAKAAETNRTRYGADYYAVIGAVGGSRSVKKGFAIDDRNLLQKLLGKKTRAQIAGQKGGMAKRA